MVYDKDMCKSKLGILMCAFRADRPSEWQMDEFIHQAEDMNCKINELTKQRDELLAALEDLKREIILSDVDMDYIDSHFMPWLNKASLAIDNTKGAAK